MTKTGCWLGLGVLAFMALPAMAADPAQIDWAKIPAATVTLFYPGQSSYEWLLNDHSMPILRMSFTLKHTPGG